MTSILEKIVETKKEELAVLKRQGVSTEFPEITPGRFREVLSRSGLSLIAEIKKASPSKGVFRENFNVEMLARDYETGGARALSVLTDQKYFLGHLQNIQEAKSASSLPVLRKDFLIDPLQITEARTAGANAVLLIAAILKGDHLAEMLSCAKEHQLDALVEIHDDKELNQVLAAGAEIIGINNRNLNTFEVSIETSLNLKNEIPSDRIAVAESGINTSQDAMQLFEAGFDAVLVGESLVLSSDPVRAIRELLGGTSK